MSNHPPFTIPENRNKTTRNYVFLSLPLIPFVRGEAQCSKMCFSKYIKCNQYKYGQWHLSTENLVYIVDYEGGSNHICVLKVERHEFATRSRPTTVNVHLLHRVTNMLQL